MRNINPSTGQIAWEGNAAAAEEVERAVRAAKDAGGAWAETSLVERERKILAVADGYRARETELVQAICLQTGKPRWEANAEVDSMIAKAAISIAAQRERRSPSSRAIGDVTAATRYVPVGVMAVLGPFNMPGHLPNGHLMPAVLAGNTVVFKPSEQAPLVGEIVGQIWESAGFPAGVFNLLQGGAETGTHLVSNDQIDGVLFTGSFAVGAAIHRALAGHPEKLLALEMGGNNPLIVWDCSDVEAAAYLIVQSAFITSGQRCSCARRLIVADDAAGQRLMERLQTMIAGIRVGLYTDEPEPFMGTVISSGAADRLLSAQDHLIQRGGKPLIQMRRDERSAALLHPGLIDMTGIPRDDEEIFGPLLQVIRVSDFDAAIQEANQTRYGLAAGLLSDRPELYEQFRRRIRAGVVNFNRALTGARSDLPFGGLGFSGNHRPSASFAADYCCDPVAALESARVALPDVLPPGIGVTSKL